MAKILSLPLMIPFLPPFLHLSPDKICFNFLSYITIGKTTQERGGLKLHIFYWLIHKITYFVQPAKLENSKSLFKVIKKQKKHFYFNATI